MDLSAFPADVGVAIVSHNNRDKIGATLASVLFAVMQTVAPAVVQRK